VEEGAQLCSEWLVGRSACFGAQDTLSAAQLVRDRSVEPRGRIQTPSPTLNHFVKQEAYGWVASAGQLGPNPCTAWEIDCAMRTTPKGVPLDTEEHIF
jgi:hypothetical protein